MSNPSIGPSSNPHPKADRISFRCLNCGQPLTVPTTIAGKSAKCPKCDTIQQVPLESEPKNSAEQSPVPPPSSPSPSSPSPSSPSPFSPSPFSSSPSPTVSPPVVSSPSSAPPEGKVEPEAGFQVRRPVSEEDPAISLKRTLRESDPGTGWDAKTGSRETPTKKLCDRIVAEISKVYVGQDELVMGALVALFSNGHILIESVPGLGKTLFVRTLGRVLGCQFGRIQFTADLMPSDITGAPIFDMKTQEFRFRPGPVFTQLLLADEINRSPAKTHAALLEIMQEYRVTVDGKSHTLDRPFLVMATQNPIESEGTYNLPEAQLDRFMFKLIADYPTEEEEASILKMHGGQFDINRRLEAELETVTSPKEIMEVIRQNGDVFVDDRLIDYINSLVRLTRQWPQFHMGASPRAGIALLQGARTLATFAGRDYAVPDDVVQIVLPTLRHRAILTAEAEVEGHKIDDLLTDLVRSVEVPRI